MSKAIITKLGLKPAHKVRFFNQPDNYLGQLGLKNLKLGNLDDCTDYDFIQVFVRGKQELESIFPLAARMLTPNGSLWVSWPKGKSKIPTDLNENIVREVGLSLGLVDVKVVAVDEDWSGLKFVYRLKDRVKKVKLS